MYFNMWAYFDHRKGPPFNHNLQNFNVESHYSFEVLFEANINRIVIVIWKYKKQISSEIKLEMRMNQYVYELKSAESK